ncbi:MAG: S8 family serine peptidase, partial [Acidobacteriota bacterium]
MMTTQVNARGSRTFRLLLVTLGVAAALGISLQGAPRPSLKERRLAELSGETAVRGLYPRPQYHARPAHLNYGKHYGQVSSGELSDPGVIRTPVGSFHMSDRGRLLKRGVPADLIESLDADPSAAPGRSAGSNRVYLVQPRLKHAEGRALLEGLGVEILGFVPNNAYRVRMSRDQLARVRGSSDVAAVESWHPFLRRGALVGRMPLPHKLMAAAETYYLLVVLQEGAAPEPVINQMRSREAIIRNVYRGYGDGLRIVTDIPVQARGLLKQLERMDAVKMFGDRMGAAGFAPLASVIPAQLMTGHYNSGRTPLYGAGVDGDSQFVAVTDDGMSLDTFSMAHALFDAEGNVVPGSVTPDLDPSNDGPGDIAPDVGPGHRKVEAYIRVQDLAACVAGLPCDGPPVGTGDFRTCDATVSGRYTHGNTVASLIAGNPTNGSRGLGITRDDFDAENGPFTAPLFEEPNLPLDGVARGARILFQDAGVTSEASICYQRGESDVDLNTISGGPGVIVSGNLINLMEQAAFRTDLNPANNTLHERGARLHVLAFGVPNFDRTLAPLNGLTTYTFDSRDLDTFLFNFRQYLTFSPAGNDASPGLETFEGLSVNADDPDTYQINPPATAKNTTTVGASASDDRGETPGDLPEFLSGYASQGPATEPSRRVMPLLVSPGGGSSAFVAGDPLFPHVAVFRSNDNDQAGPIGLNMPDGRLTDYLSDQNAGTSFSAAGAAGAGALVRDYFAKGRYPDGRAGNTQRPEMSGALVKALLMIGTNFNENAVGVPSRFSNEQGYGRIQLTAALPLENYPAMVIPDPQRYGDTLGATPTTPLSLQVADEFFDGGCTSVAEGENTCADSIGQAFARTGETRAYTVDVIDPSRQLRVALAWMDAPDDLLINDLDLRLLAPVSVDDDFDPATAAAPLVYRGNRFSGAFSFDTRRPFGDDIDSTNPTEAVILDPGEFADEDLGLDLQPGTDDCIDVSLIARAEGLDGLCDTADDVVDRYGIDGDCDGFLIGENPADPLDGDFGAPSSFNLGTFGPITCLGEGDGILNDEIQGGLNNTICNNHPATLLCQAPRPQVDLNGNGSADDAELDANGSGGLDTLTQVPVGTWTIEVQAATVTVEAPNLNDFSGAPIDQSAGAGGPAQPFALAIAGGFLAAGHSVASLDRDQYDCSDSATLSVADAAAGRTASDVEMLSEVTVHDATGAEVDREPAPPFGTGASSALFSSESMPVQATGSFIQGNGILEVADGYRLQFAYNEGDPSASQATATINCAPTLRATPFNIPGPNRAFLITGGCDNDDSLDADENILLTVNVENFGEGALEDTEASLTCSNPAGNTSDPCSMIHILDSPKQLGRLPTSIDGQLPPGQAPS